VSISTPVSCAMKPIIEKITSPANTLVPQLIKGTIIASLKQKLINRYQIINEIT
jgi:hypothetical protein